MNNRRSYFYLFSVILLIISGHFLAVYLSDRSTAWIWVALYYGLWMLATVIIFLSKKDFKKLFRRSSLHISLFFPFLFAAIALIGIFLPNLGLLKFDDMLLMNAVICLMNPFIEELYWRALPSTLFRSKLVSFLVASLGFAIGHPLILGVNSLGASGWPTLAGAFILGSSWWFYYNKKQSLVWPVFTHFLIDLFGLSAYLLANQVPLLL